MSSEFSAALQQLPPLPPVLEAPWFSQIFGKPQAMLYLKWEKMLLEGEKISSWEFESHQILPALIHYKRGVFFGKVERLFSDYNAISPVWSSRIVENPREFSPIAHALAYLNTFKRLASVLAQHYQLAPAPEANFGFAALFPHLLGCTQQYLFFRMCGIKKAYWHTVFVERFIEWYERILILLPLFYADGVPHPPTHPAPTIANMQQFLVPKHRTPIRRNKTTTPSSLASSLSYARANTPQPHHSRQKFKYHPDTRHFYKDPSLFDPAAFFTKDLNTYPNAQLLITLHMLFKLPFNAFVPNICATTSAIYAALRSKDQFFCGKLRKNTIEMLTFYRQQHFPDLGEPTLSLAPSPAPLASSPTYAQGEKIIALLEQILAKP